VLEVQRLLEEEDGGAEVAQLDVDLCLLGVDSRDRLVVEQNLVELLQSLLKVGVLDVLRTPLEPPLDRILDLRRVIERLNDCHWG
jgi:hypothetical protein